MKGGLTQNQIKTLDRLVQEHRDTSCKLCGRPSDLVHHKISRRNMAVRYDPDNHISLCDNCHNEHHKGIIRIEPSPELRLKASKIAKNLNYKELQGKLSKK